jgi:hypothetical protein
MFRLGTRVGWCGCGALGGVGGLPDFVATQSKQNEEYYIHGVVREIIEMPVL